MNIRDSHVSAPFFGPNVWNALVQPVPGGGISAPLPAVQMKVTFKEGGAFDFHTNFERIKERFQEARETANESSRGQQTVDLSAVHLEDLPPYEAPSNAPPNANQSISPREPRGEITPNPASRDEPVEPPPCYEEVQSQSVAHELEERLRRAS